MCRQIGSQVAGAAVEQFEREFHSVRQDAVFRGLCTVARNTRPAISSALKGCRVHC